MPDPLRIMGGTVITRPGDKIFSFPDEQGHRGIDIALPAGASIRSFTDGVLVDPKSLGLSAGYGRAIVVRDNQNRYWIYGHSEDGALAEPGEPVGRGQVLGTVNDQSQHKHPGEAAQGDHVHVEVRVAGQYARQVDPLSTPEVLGFQQMPRAGEGGTPMTNSLRAEPEDPLGLTPTVPAPAAPSDSGGESAGSGRTNPLIEGARKAAKKASDEVAAWKAEKDKQQRALDKLLAGDASQLLDSRQQITAVNEALRHANTQIEHFQNVERAQNTIADREQARIDAAAEKTPPVSSQYFTPSAADKYILQRNPDGTIKMKPDGVTPETTLNPNYQPPREPREARQPFYHFRDDAGNNYTFDPNTGNATPLPGEKKPVTPQHFQGLDGYEYVLSADGHTATRVAGQGERPTQYQLTTDPETGDVWTYDPRTGQTGAKLFSGKPPVHTTTVGGRAIGINPQTGQVQFTTDLRTDEERQEAQLQAQAHQQAYQIAQTARDEISAALALPDGQARDAALQTAVQKWTALSGPEGAVRLLELGRQEAERQQRQKQAEAELAQRQKQAEAEAAQRQRDLEETNRANIARELTARTTARTGQQQAATQATQQYATSGVASAPFMTNLLSAQAPILDREGVQKLGQQMGVAQPVMDAVLSGFDAFQRQQAALSAQRLPTTPTTSTPVTSPPRPAAAGAARPATPAGEPSALPSGATGRSPTTGQPMYGTIGPGGYNWTPQQPDGSAAAASALVPAPGSGTPPGPPGTPAPPSTIEELLRQLDLMPSPSSGAAPY